MTKARRLAVVARIHAIQSRDAARLERALRRFFRAQARRVVERYLTNHKADGGSGLLERYLIYDAPPVRGLPPNVPTFSYRVKAAVLEDLFPVDEFAELRLLLTRLLTPTVDAVSELAGDLVGEPKLPPASPRLLALLRHVGDHDKLITDATRQAVEDVIRAGVEAGYSDYQIAHGVAKDGYRGIDDVAGGMYRNRAETISRTEVAYASQAAAHERYGAAGITEVDILDGENCGWKYHDDPDIADGSVRTLEDAQQHPIAHQRCRRVSLPRLESRTR